MKKFIYGMLTMYFLGRIADWWGKIFLAVFGKPAVKASITDATSSAIDKAVFGDRPRSDYSTGRIDYSSPRTWRRRNSITIVKLPLDPKLHTVDNYVFDKAGDIQVVIEAIENHFNSRVWLSISDLADLLDLESHYGDSRRGWDSASDFKIVTNRVKYQTDRGYRLAFPEPKSPRG